VLSVSEGEGSTTSKVWRGLYLLCTQLSIWGIVSSPRGTSVEMGFGVIYSPAEKSNSIVTYANISAIPYPAPWPVPSYTAW